MSVFRRGPTEWIDLEEREGGGVRMGGFFRGHS